MTIHLTCSAEGVLKQVQGDERSRLDVVAKTATVVQCIGLRWLSLGDVVVSQVITRTSSSVRDNTDDQVEQGRNRCRFDITSARSCLIICDGQITTCCTIACKWPLARQSLSETIQVCLRCTSVGEQLDGNAHQCCNCRCLISTSGVSSVSGNAAVNRLSAICQSVSSNRLIAKNLNCNVTCLLKDVLGFSCLRRHVRDRVSCNVELGCIEHLVIATVLQVEDQSVQNVFDVINAVLVTTRDSQ